MGDAAHVHSPAGGQGMNTGMQDAFNLAWKLALVFHNSCDERLLDSYSPERSAVGDAVLKSAGMLTTVGTMKNPVAQTLRNLVGHIVLGLSPVQHAVADTMTEVTIGLFREPAERALSGRHRPKARPAGRTSIGPSAGRRRQCTSFCSFRGQHHRHGRPCGKIPRAAGSRRAPTFARWRHLAGSARRLSRLFFH